MQALALKRRAALFYLANAGKNLFTGPEPRLSTQAHPAVTNSKSISIWRLAVKPRFLNRAQIRRFLGHNNFLVRGRAVSISDLSLHQRLGQ
jgi:hypothetical protein